ncbi:MAG: rhomboid family intramembrane serine protease [Bacteroidetes bacterium]|jgi:membrane associated rhomboid family serine protease|nr:rhomboid family intramembrane serine protease [Bacteroidota bacterium]
MNTRITEVVKNLLIINGLFFLATMFYEDFMLEKFSLFLPGSSMFMPHQLVTHMFMHGGIGHILGNMFALFMFGPALEMRLGAKRFVYYYMATGLGAAALHLGVKYLEIWPYFNSLDPALVSEVMDEGYRILKEGKNYIQPDAATFNQLVNMPTVGASGAVFGILLAFGMLFPNITIYLYFALPIKAKHFVMLYGAMELYLGLQNNPGDNVAHFAHLGGMLFGFLLLRHWQKETYY